VHQNTPFQGSIIKNFLGQGAPHPTPLGAFGASMLGAFGASILGAFGASVRLGAFGASILSSPSLL